MLDKSRAASSRVVESARDDGNSEVSENVGKERGAASWVVVEFYSDSSTGIAYVNGQGDHFLIYIVPSACCDWCRGTAAHYNNCLHSRSRTRVLPSDPSKATFD